MFGVPVSNSASSNPDAGHEIWQIIPNGSGHPRCYCSAPHGLSGSLTIIVNGGYAGTYDKTQYAVVDSTRFDLIGTDYLFAAANARWDYA